LLETSDKNFGMPAFTKLFVVLGGVNAMLVVILGAFGAHFLKTRIPGDMMAVYQTAVLYHAIHALGLIAIGVVTAWLTESMYLKSAGWVMFTGIVLFSGSLYLLSITGVRWLGAITPIGGVALLLAWLLFCVAVLKAAN
jgi:uncharacterized membrane protein YgdD (TMEM256/DUF423 family)